jgi:hypothetical protein
MRSGRDRVGVQGSHARCGRSCSAATANGFAREQWGHAWRMSEADVEKAADEVRRHRELLVEDTEMDPVRAGFGFRRGRGGECDMVQDRQPARLVSTSACAREATGHARAG